MIFKERRERLLEESKSECVLLINIEGSSKPALTYYTGFTGSFATLLLTPGEELFITDPRYTEQAKKQTGMNVVEYRGGKKFTEFLADILKEKGCKKVGVEKERLSLSLYESLVANLEGCEFAGIDDVIKKHRMAKTPEEVEKIKKAIDIAQKAFLELLDFMKPGMTEREAAAYLEYRMKALGAESVAFETILASGPRSALPHGIASGKVMEKGEVVVVDFGCFYEGYCSDMTRMVSFGEPPDEVKKVHEIVFQAQERAIKGAKPGMKGKEIDALARSYIEEQGYGKEFGHGLGHGIGLEVHEAPRVSRMGEDEIKPGYVFTIEPGIYLEGRFGIRIEEDVLMTDKGVEVLTSLDRGIFVI